MIILVLFIECNARIPIAIHVDAEQSTTYGIETELPLPILTAIDHDSSIPTSLRDHRRSSDESHTAAVSATSATVTTANVAGNIDENTAEYIHRRDNTAITNQLTSVSDRTSNSSTSTVVSSVSTRLSLRISESEFNETIGRAFPRTFSQHLRKLVGSNCVLIESGTVTPYYECIGCDIRQAMGCLTDLRTNKSGNILSSCSMNSVNEVSGGSDCCPRFKNDPVTGKIHLLVFLSSCFCLPLWLNVIL